MAKAASTRRWCITAAAMLAAACGATNTIGNQSLGAVVTVVDSGPALHSARTFVLPDTVIRLAQRGSAVDPAIARELVGEVRAHFAVLGWTEIPNAPESHPDVVVILAASTQTETALVYPDWFSAWGYLPYWGAGVNASWTLGYPTGAVPFTYQTGTLLVTMIDVRTPRGDTKTIPVLWAAALDGLVGDVSTPSRVRGAIDQAFEQSPYLRLQ